MSHILPLRVRQLGRSYSISFPQVPPYCLRHSYAIGTELFTSRITHHPDGTAAIQPEADYVRTRDGSGSIWARQEDTTQLCAICLYESESYFR